MSNGDQARGPSSSPSPEWRDTTWLELRAGLEGVLPLLDRIAGYGHNEECDAHNACENCDEDGPCHFDEEQDERVHDHRSCNCGVWDSASKAKDVRAILDRTTPPEWRAFAEAARG